MWNSGRNLNNRKAALAEGYIEEAQENQGRKFSGSTAMILGLFITLEIMIGGAMIFNYDFHGVNIEETTFTNEFAQTYQEKSLKLTKNKE